MWAAFLCWLEVVEQRSKGLELLTSLVGSEQEMGTGGSPEVAGKACDDPGKSK